MPGTPANSRHVARERAEGEGAAKSAVVVPTNRHDRITRFLDAWKDEFALSASRMDLRDAGHAVIVIEDNPQRTFDLGRWGVEHYSWKEIDDELGSDSWIIPRRTDCIRSFGFLKAWQRKVDFIVTLDDDCLTAAAGEPGFVAKHWEMLATPASSPAWVSTVDGAAPRGLPYVARNRSSECMLNHGLWQGVPDFDALTQLQAVRQPSNVVPVEQVVPRGSYFPMCGMNLAFKTELAPIMYFLLMGNDCPYDRFGDIWCGIFAKRICDHLGYSVRSGRPLIDHQRASDVWVNLRKEAPAYEVNERLWQVVDSAVITGRTFVDCYRELADQLTLPGEYWARLRNAMHVWSGLFACQTTRREEHHLVEREITGVLGVP